MLTRSQARKKTRELWKNCENPEARLHKEVPVPPERVRPVSVTNYMIAFVLGIIEIESFRQIYDIFASHVSMQTEIPQILLYFALLLIASIGMILTINRISVLTSGSRAAGKCAEALLDALKDRNMVAKECQLKTDGVRDDGILIETLYCIDHASSREQTVFCTALQEMMSPVRNPRCLMLGRGLRHPAYYRSLACPSILGKNKEDAEALAARLSRVWGKTAAVYTRNKQGRRHILNAREKSIISRHERIERCFEHYGALGQRTT